MFNKTFLLSTSVLMAAAIAMPANAQVEDEIIVTATKRTTTLQATPVAVTVTSADTIEKAAILDITDLQSVVPSLRVGQLQTSTSTNFRIRGFGNGANNAGIEPSVGVFIDGVYRSRSAAQIGDLPKLERIEVLNGPQSTLFGKNASAGVISIVTAKPTFETQGYISGGVGNYNQRILRAYASGGLSDTLAVSLGGSINKRDGYAKSAVEGLTDNNERDRFNLRGQLLVEPSDEVSIRFIADLSEIDENCCHVTNVVNGPTAGAIQALGGRLADANNPYAYTNYQNSDSINTVKDRGISMHVDVDMGAYAVTAITSYRSNESGYNFDADFSTADLLISRDDTQIGTFTQEVRLTSMGDNKIDWMLGGYFFNESIENENAIEAGTAFRSYLNILSGGALNGIEALFGHRPGTFFNADVANAGFFKQDDQAYSGFATVDYHVNDKLTLTGGLNYTNDKKKVTGRTENNEVYSNIDLNNDLTVYGVTLPTVLFGQAFTDATTLAPTPANIGAVEAGRPGTVAAINAGVANGISGLQGLQFLPQFLAFPNSVEDAQSTDDKITWSLRGAYEVSDNLNLYASAGTGFKSSSWNLSRDSRPFPTDAAALRSAGLTLANQTYGTRFARPELATVYELGLKARFEKGAVNVAVFDQSIKDFQANTFVGTGFVLSNAGKQSTKGVEFDASYYPIDALKLTFAGIYLDAKYDSFVGASGPSGTVVDLSGKDVAGVPDFGFSTSSTYTHDFGGGNTGFIRADYQYESSESPVEQILTGIDNPESKASFLNGAMGFTLDNGFGMQVWGRNILGHETIISAFPGVVQSGTINAYPTAPATYGVLLRQDF